MHNDRLVAILLVGLILGACQLDPKDSGHADSVLVGGKIFTVNDAHPWAQAVAIKNGEFVYVGDDSGAQGFVGPETVRHDLKGKLVIPGMVDAHTHPGAMGRYPAPAPLPVTSKEDILAAVKAYSEANPDLRWIKMCCWPIHLYGNGLQGPHKRDLDAIVPDQPVWLASDIGHSIWVNSVALKMMGVDRHTPDPVPDMAIYGRDADGELSGWIKEKTYRPFMKQFFKIDPEANRKGIVTFLEYLNRHGVTSLYDAGNTYFHDEIYSFLAELDRAGKLPVRIEGSYHIILPGQEVEAVEQLQRLRRIYGGDRLQFSTVKIHFDGSNENRTGAVLEPFSDDPGNRGNTLFNTAELHDLILRLHEARVDLHVHTVGDRGVRIVLDAVEGAREALGGELYTRATVTHLDIIDTDDYPRFKKLGVVANYTPAWHGRNTGDPVMFALGKERFERTLMAQPLFDDGAAVTFSSDITSLGSMPGANPFLGMQTAHNRQYPGEEGMAGSDPPEIRLPLSERLRIEDLIRGYTLNGAYQLRMDDRIGSIEVGKLADLVVLEKNLFEVDRYEISKVKPETVIMEGKIIYGELQDR